MYLLLVGFASNVKLKHLKEKDQILITEMRLSITEITKILWIQTKISLKDMPTTKKG